MKPHLLLTHSFPTNSVLLHGLKEFLSDYFTVHFIDLPGFHESSPAFHNSITLKKFSNYFDHKIAELGLDEYIVGGVSFGFLVINNAKLDKRCKAILAMEPFINTQCLNIPFWKQKKFIIISTLLNLMSFFNKEKQIWESQLFKEYFQTESGYPKERIDRITKHIDPHTFFSVTRLLLNYKKYPKFHNLPYFLIGNFSDKTINFDSVVKIFIKNLSELHIASEPIDHYPKDLTKEYFKTRIPKEHISRMIACMEDSFS
ncbi:MAG: alpha/beta fold hydrolase [Candidatus Paceibacterota bacterium]